jgi:putative effector of murein hydrolase
LNPVAIAVALLIGILVITDTPYAVYFDGAQFVHFLLGPATVSLAIPLYRQRERLGALALPIGAALLVGVLTASLSAIGLAAWLGADTATQVSLAPKSVTAPVAMGISEKLGGIPSLTAVLVVSTGIVGAVFGTGVLRLAADSRRCGQRRRHGGDLARHRHRACVPGESRPWAPSRVWRWRCRPF